jgi:hypothetical protein
MSIDTEELDLARSDEDLAPAPVSDEPAVDRPVNDRTPLRIVLTTVAIGAVLVLVYQLYWPQVQDYWFSTRQRNLSNDLVAPRPGIPVGHAFAALQLITFDKATSSVAPLANLVVVQGESPSDLRAAPGHRIGTPKPGQRGNTVIVGHRDAWGGPFAKLGTMHKGDVIVAQAHGGPDHALLGKPIVYTVVSVKHVGADAPRLVADSTDYRLTLVTHDGGDLSDSHVVVSAVSGTVGKLRRPTSADHLDPPKASVLAWPLVVAFVAFGLAALALNSLRRRYRTLPVALVVGPLVVAGLFGLLVELGAFLPPLR